MFFRILFLCFVDVIFCSILYSQTERKLEDSQVYLKEPMRFLQDLYTQYYEANCVASFVLDSVDLVNVSEFSGMDLSNAEFELFHKTNALKKSSGVLVVKIQEKKLFLQYKISAHITVFYALKDLSAGKSFDGFVGERRVKFERFTSLPACRDDFKYNVAKVYLPKDMTITKDRLRAKILVKKGDFVQVKAQGDGFVLQHSLQALQSGSYGEVINVKNIQSGKIVRIKIVDKNQGVLL